MFEVKTNDKTAFDVLVKLHEESANYDFWSEPRGSHLSTDIMVPPAFQQTFIELMEAFNIDYKVKINNVQRFLKNGIIIVYSNNCENKLFFLYTIVSLIEESRKSVNSAAPLVKQSKKTKRDARYSLNWTTYSDYPIVNISFVHNFLKSVT